MKTYVLTYRFVPNVFERRTPYREAHFAHLEKAIAGGHLVLAGPFDDPYDGGLLLVRFDSQGDVLAWAAEDPYVRSGLVAELTVRAF
ncbi:MAG: hypothetical protein KGJ86_01535, partial [Chloroflexota bacterium]|nr:hypothetical protein [Chloroflexota bacterium]